MAGGKKTPNSKAVAANAKKAAHAEQKAAEKAAHVEAETAKDWQKGANNRKAARDDAAAAKADEAARKRREKAELLAAEEAESGGATKTKIKTPTKKNNKKKNDLSLLEDALVSAADKKVKKKKADLKAKEEAQKQSLTSSATSGAAAAPATDSDKMMAATETMLEGGDTAGRQANVDRMKAEETSGIDNALNSLGVSSPDAKSAKALYNEFEAKMLPIVKEEHPGLRLSQYKEKIFQLWKKSPENPANQVPASK